jgi:hypothetical protein
LQSRFLSNGQAAVLSQSLSLEWHELNLFNLTTGMVNESIHILQSKYIISDHTPFIVLALSVIKQFQNSSCPLSLSSSGTNYLEVYCIHSLLSSSPSTPALIPLKAEGVSE